MRSPASRLALAGIGAYQRFLSPYKGFRCAHHACTGGMTCSNYGLFAIREHGLRAAIPRIRERLADCSQYATDPMKGKISEDDPGPLECGRCESETVNDIASAIACGSLLGLLLPS